MSKKQRQRRRPEREPGPDASAHNENVEVPSVVRAHARVDENAVVIHDLKAFCTQSGLTLARARPYLKLYLDDGPKPSLPHKGSLR